MSDGIEIDVRYEMSNGVYGFVHIGETRVVFCPPSCLTNAADKIVMIPAKGWKWPPRDDREAAADALRQRFPECEVSL